MKFKFLTLLTIFSIFAIIGCQNDTTETKTDNIGFSIPATYQGSNSFKVGLGYIPKHVKAVALFCSYNNFDVNKVNGTKYIVKIENAKAKDDVAWFAEWKFENITFNKVFWFQFVPMADGNDKLDDTWWHYAISGHPNYHEDGTQNNIVVDFKSKNVIDGCYIVVNDGTYRAGSRSTTDFKTWGMTHDEEITEQYWLSNFPVFKTHEERFFNINYAGCYAVDNPEQN